MIGKNDSTAIGGINIMRIDEFVERKSVFKNAQVLTEDYIPSKLLFREEEMKTIMSNLTAFFQQIKPNNMFILGQPSTGKTHILIAISNALSEEAKKRDLNIHYIYTNIGSMTLPQALVEIANSMGIHATKTMGLEIASKIKDEVRKTGQYYCFILDEYDKMKVTRDHKNPYDVLINIFSRMGSHVCVTVVANNKNILSNIEPATKSSFSPQKLYFRDYNALEVTNILKDRCALAFSENVIDPAVISRFGAWIYRSGVDLRTSLKILLNAGRKLANDGGTCITFEGLMTAFKEVERNMMSDVISKLNDSEILLIHAIASAQKSRNVKEVEKNIVYSAYCDLCNKLELQPLTWKHLITYICPKIEALHIINSDVHGRGKGKGTSTYFSIDGAELDDIIHMTKEEISNRVSETRYT